MTTVADLVQETRALLYSTAQIEQNRLGSAIDASTTTVTFSYDLGGIVPGVKFSIGEELMYVWAVNSQTNTVTVERGFLGTTAATHSSGDIADVNPPFPVHTIKNELRKEIQSWPADLFAVGTVDVTVSGTYKSQGVDLGISEDWWNVLDIRHSPRDVQAPSNYNAVWGEVNWFSIFREAPVASFASGAAILVNNTVPDGTLRIVYSKPFDVSTWEDATDVEATVGLPGSALDIPVVGAAWRLTSFREVKRSFDEAQGESRMAQEVPPGTAISGADYFRNIRRLRIAEESAKLHAKYPRRHT